MFLKFGDEKLQKPMVFQAFKASETLQGKMLRLRKAPNQDFEDLGLFLPQKQYLFFAPPRRAKYVLSPLVIDSYAHHRHHCLTKKMFQTRHH